jgi:hypothetical protein
MRTDPRLTVGQANTAWSCQRHASMLLDPEQPRARVSDGAFRLTNAVSVAVLDAHRLHDDRLAPQDPGLSDALGLAVAPPELGHEEAARFRTALDAYEEAFGSQVEADAVQVHAKADTPLKTAIGHSGVMLTGTVRLAFAPTDGESAKRSGSIIVRSVSVGPLPSGGTSDTRSDALRLIALGAAEGETQRLFVSPGGASQLKSTSFSHLELRETFREFGEVVDAAVAAGPNATPTDGWWCAGCAFVRNCPAVSTARTTDLIEAYPR